MKTIYKVELSNRGNINHGQNPEQPIYGTKSDFFIDIEHPIDASIVVRQYISNYDLGASEFTGGDVFHNDTKIGYVSYNGKLWNCEGELI